LWDKKNEKEATANINSVLEHVQEKKNKEKAKENACRTERQKYSAVE